MSGQLEGIKKFDKSYENLRRKLASSTKLQQDFLETLVKKGLARNEMEADACLTRGIGTPQQVESYQKILAEQQTLLRDMGTMIGWFSGWSRYFYFKKEEYHSTEQCPALIAESKNHIFTKMMTSLSGENPRKVARTQKLCKRCYAVTITDKLKRGFSGLDRV